MAAAVRGPSADENEIMLRVLREQERVMAAASAKHQAAVAASRAVAAGGTVEANTANTAPPAVGQVRLPPLEITLLQVIAGKRKPR